MSLKEQESKERFRPGDVFDGYYFPGVLCGRTLCYYRDILKLLHKYNNKIKEIGYIINFKEPGTFRIMSNIYREMNFSSIQFCTEIEESSECFQILIGVVIKLFDKKDELKIIKEKEIDIEGDFSVLKNNEKNDDVVDLNVSMMIMDSLQDISESNNLINDNEIELIHHNVSLIYLLFLLYKSQYKIPLEENFSNCDFFNYSRISISIDTLKMIRRVIEDCNKKGDIFPEAKLIIFRMINEGNFQINLYNGPYYYYQDRYGNPLVPDPLEKRFMDYLEYNLDNDFVEDEDKEGEFIEYVYNLKERLVQRIKEKFNLLSDNETQDHDNLSYFYDFEQLLDSFNKKLEEYEFYKSLYYSKMKVEFKEREKNSSNINKGKKRKYNRLFNEEFKKNLNHPTQIRYSNASSEFTSERKNEYGDWNELFKEYDTNNESSNEVISEQILNDNINNYLNNEDKNDNNNDNNDNNSPEIQISDMQSLNETGEKIHSEIDEFNGESKEIVCSDNSLFSLLNRIEELLNKEI